jgi:predicted RNA-binding Zn ribbon-like protein
MTSKQASGYKNPEVLKAAESLVALLNTRPHAHLGDSLADGSAVDVLKLFAPEDTAPGKTDLAGVVRLRDALAQTLRTNDDVTERAWSDVSDLVSTAPVRRVFTPSEVSFVPAGGDKVMSGIATAVQHIVDAESWSRLRVCPNHLCELAFYDTTRSRTQKWDSYDTCGNRANVSAHRARQQQRVGEK